MKFLLVATFFLVVELIVAKEQVIYEAKGADLIDLIRGRPPQGGALKLSKVDNVRENLPDGIYYEPPEDEALEAPGDEQSSYLYLNDKKAEVPESIPQDAPSSEKKETPDKTSS